jgi:RHS repeat-associated protein
MWVYVSQYAGADDTCWYKGGSTETDPGYDMQLGGGFWFAQISDGSTKVLKLFGHVAGLQNRWVFLAAVVDRENHEFRVYRDGVPYLTPSDITGLGSLANATSATIGARSDESCPFKGKIDDVMIIKKALSPAEVAALYNSFTLNWDKNGQMTNLPSTGTSQAVWNWDGKMRSATMGSDTISLKYDPMGNRVLRTANGTTRKYVVDVAAALPTILLELDYSGAVQKTYIHADGEILAQHDGGISAPRYFYLHDRLGSVRQVIDASTTPVVKNTYTYEPFGQVIASSGTFDNPFMFTGQYFDSEIDEYYLRARQYNPAISRFTSRDPLGGKLREPLTLHKYLYCQNNPINRADPSGKWAVIGQYGGFTGGYKLLGHEYTRTSKMFFYGVEEGTYNVFWGNVTFKTTGDSFVSSLAGVSFGITLGFSPNAQRPEDLAGRYFAGGFSVGLPGGYSGGYSRTWSPETGTIVDFVTAGYGLGFPPWDVHFHGGIGTVSDAQSFGPQPPPEDR